MKNITQDQLTRLNSNYCAFGIFVDFLLPDTNFYIWTGKRDITVAGIEYKANYLAGVNQINTEINGVPSPVVVSLMLNDSNKNTMIARFMKQNIRKRICKIKLGIFDSRDGHLESDSLIDLFVGYLDSPSLKAGEQTSITVSVESLFWELKNKKGRYFDSQSQRQIHPDDASMDYVDSLKGKMSKLLWG